MKHIIFYIVVSILFVSVFSCKQRKNMQYLPFFYMKNYEVMHSKKYISIRENEYSDIDDTGFVWNLYNKNEPTLKSKACLKCLYFTKIISDLCRNLEYFSYLYTIN